MSEHELWNELGNLYFLSGSYDHAIHAYTQSIALDKGFGRSYSNMATAYAQKGRYGEAIILYQRGIKLLTDNREKASSWHKLGNVYRTLKEYQLAMSAYQKADELSLDIYPGGSSGNEIDALLNRRPVTGDVVHFVDEDPSEEKKNTESPSASISSPELHPFSEEFTPWWFDDQVVPEEDHVPFDNGTWSVEITGNLEAESDIIFKEPLKWDVAGSNNVVMVDDAAQNMEPPKSLQFAGDYGLSDFQNSIQEQQVLDVRAFSTEEQLAHVVVIVPEPEVVTTVPEFVAENLTDSDPVSYETLVEPLIIELTHEDRTAILADIDRIKRVLDVNPRNASAWNSMGAKYKELGQYDEAINAYQKAVSLDSSKAFYFHHLGLVYAAVERIDDAIAAFERVIEIDPKHSLAHATLGGYYQKMGMEEQAQEHIQKAKGLLDDDENEYNRACLEAICGNSDHALELLEVALKNKQTYVNWVRRDPDLDFIRNDPRFQTLLGEYAMKPSQ